MNASPSRCSSGPQSSTGTREEPAWVSMSADVGLLDVDVGSSSSSPSRSVESMRTPCSSSSPLTTWTSEISGMPRSRHGSSARTTATIALETRFLAPRTSMSPTRGLPPSTTSAAVMPHQPNTDAARRRRLEPSPPRGVACWSQRVDFLAGAFLRGGSLLRRGLLGGRRPWREPSSPRPSRRSALVAVTFFAGAFFAAALAGASAVPSSPAAFAGAALVAVTFFAGAFFAAALAGAALAGAFLAGAFFAGAALVAPAAFVPWRRSRRPPSSPPPWREPLPWTPCGRRP